MTTFLFSPILTTGADKMAQTDPHGFLLTVISVSVVFVALLVLYGLYSLSGAFFSGKFKQDPAKKKVKAAKGTPDAEVAAAIALALDAELNCGGEIEAAIATALHLYLGDTTHDVEPGFITIRRTESAWNNKQLNFRKLPR